MHPWRGLDELARRKAQLQARIRLDRAVLAAHGRRLQRPVIWTERAMEWGERVRAWWPWVGVPLISSLFLPPTARRWRQAGGWLRWAPWVWRLVSAARRRPARA